MKKIFSRILPLLLLLLAAGCRPEGTEEALAPLRIREVGVDASVTPLTAGDPATRVPAEAQEAERLTAQYDATVFQFDASGHKLHHSRAARVSVTAGTPLALPLFDLAEGEHQQLVLYLLPAGQERSALLSATTIDALLATSLPWNGESDSESFPLLGRLDGVSVNGYGILSGEGTGVFRLRRSGCRLDFDFEFTVPGYTLNAVTIHNIPAHTTGISGNAAYPALSGTEQLVSRRLLPTAQSGAYRLYLPANARGTGTNLSDDPRRKIADHAPDSYCTWLQLECAADNDPSQTVRFNLYPGSDALNDFNLLANHAYRVSARLKGLDAEDLRIEGLGDMGFWIDVADWDDKLGNKHPSYIQYLLSDDQWVTATVTHFLGKRIHYSFDKQSPPEEEFAARTIRLIRMVDKQGRIMSWKSHIYTGIEAEGDVILPYDKSTLAKGVDYSWIFQGLQNKQGEYEVCSKRTLTNVRRYPAGAFRQISAVNLSGTDWEPIGSSRTGTPFTGVYQGDGYRIENLTLTKRDLSDGVGLFGYARNARLDGIRIASSAYIYCLGLYTGAIVGMADNCRISRCSNGARIDIRHDGLGGNENSIYTYAGGIVGYLKRGTIEDCYHTGPMGGQCWWYYGAAGNIAGAFEYIPGTESGITSCYTSGNNHSLNGNKIIKAGIMGVGYNITLQNDEFYPFGVISDNYCHWDGADYVSGSPRNNNQKYKLGDNYGGQGFGMKSQKFTDILNSNRGSEWSWDGSRNNGYPYLSIEKN